MKRITKIVIAIVLVITFTAGLTVYAEDIVTERSLPDRINLVLFGLSGDNDGLDTNRTDSIIVVTIDNENKQLKFTSVLRDLKAAIEGHEPQKINAAYRYGGPELALQTLNENFNLDLTEYITVNFEQFVDIINALGGADAVLTPAEVDYLNEDPYVGNEFSEGYHRLDGLQTLEYCRIRKIDSDVVRSARQRKILRGLVERLSGMNLIDLSNIMVSFLDIVEATSLNAPAVMTLVSIPYAEYEIINNHIPDADIEAYVEGGIDEHGEWVWFTDLTSEAERFNDIVYNKQPAQEPEE